MVSCKLEMHVTCQFVNYKRVIRFPVKCLFYRYYFSILYIVVRLRELNNKYLLLNQRNFFLKKQDGVTAKLADMVCIESRHSNSS